jgi:rRNA maturation endonuclease Nob1
MAEKKEELEPCIRCGAMPEKDDKYCIRCGAPLINRCTKKKSPLHKGCSKINRRDAAFCAACGSPTVFREAGLI